MAIGGKTLGIVSGLAVGLTSGVILAALNPIVPPKGDPAQTHPIADAGVSSEPVEKADPALPKLSMVDTSPEAADAPAAPGVQDEPTAQVTEPNDGVAEPVVAEPVLEQPSVEPTQTAELETLAPIQKTTTELALVLPENSDASDVDAAPEHPVAASIDTQPTVSTDPAEAVTLAEPTLDTQSPRVGTAIIAKAAPVDVTAVDAAKQTQEPTELAPSQTVVASLPTIEDPETPKPAIAVVEETTESQEAAQDAKPNTTGTFKTTGGSIITRGSSLPKIGETNETGLASLGAGSGSSRFKTIGDSAKVMGEAASDVGALVRNANEFPVTDDPLMSVILMDNGKIAAQLPSLQKLNLPLTIAVSLDDADANARATTYRDAGFEVLAMTPRNVQLSLSGGQSNDQVSALLDQYFDIMPNSVGLIDRPSANLQKDQKLSRAVVKHFAKTGHGLVTYAGGLNGVKRIADQENVSSGAVFRFLDKSGEAGQIVTQQLDRAAREARSKGTVIVMATPSAATLSTLVGWSLSSKARAVTLAPVSASLLKN